MAKRKSIKGQTMSIAMELTFKEKSESLTLMSLNVNDR
jgi:hypothetical protein